MVESSTLGVDTTDPTKAAGVIAESIDASLVKGTVVVAATSNNTS